MAGSFASNPAYIMPVAQPLVFLNERKLKIAFAFVNLESTQREGLPAEFISARNV